MSTRQALQTAGQKKQKQPTMTANVIPTGQSPGKVARRKAARRVEENKRRVAEIDAKQEETAARPRARARKEKEESKEPTGAAPEGATPLEKICGWCGGAPTSPDHELAHLRCPGPSGCECGRLQHAPDERVRKLQSATTHLPVEKCIERDAGLTPEMLARAATVAEWGAQAMVLFIRAFRDESKNAEPMKVAALRKELVEQHGMAKQFVAKFEHDKCVELVADRRAIKAAHAQRDKLDATKQRLAKVRRVPEEIPTSEEQQGEEGTMATATLNRKRTSNRGGGQVGQMTDQEVIKELTRAVKDGVTSGSAATTWLRDHGHKINGGRVREMFAKLPKDVLAIVDRKRATPVKKAAPAKKAAKKAPVSKKATAKKTPAKKTSAKRAARQTAAGFPRSKGGRK